MTTTTKLQIVKVKYAGDDSREYSYYSEDTLKPGDEIIAPTRNGNRKAIVIEVDLPEELIALFRDKIRTIPAGSVLHELYEKRLELPEDNYTLIEDKVPEANQQKALIEIQPEATPGYLRLKDSLTSLKQYAENRVIATEQDLAPATDDLVIIAGCKTELITLRDKYLKPIQGHLDTVRNAFKVLAELLAEAEIINRQKIKQFNQEQEKRAAEIEKINREAVELAKKQAAINNGEFTVDTTPIATPAPVKHVATMQGTASIVSAPPTWEIINQSEIPFEYYILDTKKIGRVIRAGGHIPGIRIIKQQTVRVTTR